MSRPARHLLAAAGLVTLLAGACGPSPDEAEAIDRVEAILDEVTADLTAQPDVVEAVARVGDVAALPGDTRDPSRIQVTFESTAEDPSRIHDQMVQTAREVWRSDIPTIHDLQVTGAREPATTGGTSLMESWRLEDVPGMQLSSDPADLERAFGPRPATD